MSSTRRDFLRWTAAGAAASAWTPLWARAPWAADGGAAERAKNGRRLVLLFLEGGNDGLNTIVPVEDDRYHRARPRLRVAGDGAPRLDEVTALHPALAAWQGLHDEGLLSVIRDVGYDRPDRSHFVSRDIWHCGRRDAEEFDAGWVGRAAAARDGEALPPAALGAAESPLLLKTETRNGLTISNVRDFRLRLPDEDGVRHLDAMRAGADGAEEGLAGRISAAARDTYRTAERLREAVARIPAGDDYPPSGLADRLRLLARLVRAEEGPAVTWTRLGGFDTHAVQDGTHTALLRQVGDATAAFLRDLQRDGSHERTLVLIYSEFGRRVRENGSAGTDHGTAGPVIALGGGLRGGLIGAPPDLDDLVKGDLRVQHDFRAVFSEALEEWLGWPAAGLFDGDYADGRGRVGFLAG